jgi:hypothetical protein
MGDCFDLYPTNCHHKHQNRINSGETTQGFVTLTPIEDAKENSFLTKRPFYAIRYQICFMSL